MLYKHILENNKLKFDMNLIFTLSKNKIILFFCLNEINSSSDHQKIGILTDALNVTRSLGKDPSLPIRTVVTIPVVIVCVELAIVLSVHVWRKQRVNKQDMDKK